MPTSLTASSQHLSTTCSMKLAAHPRHRHSTEILEMNDTLTSRVPSHEGDIASQNGLTQAPGSHHRGRSRWPGRSHRDHPSRPLRHDPRANEGPDRGKLLPLLLEHWPLSAWPLGRCRHPGPAQCNSHPRPLGSPARPDLGRGGAVELHPAHMAHRRRSVACHAPFSSRREQQRIFPPGRG